MERTIQLRERRVAPNIEQIGDLTVLGFTKDHHGRKVFHCRCVCGKEITPRIPDVLSGKQKSCGCTNQPRVQHGMSNTPTWRSWKAMRERCLTEGSKDYPRYGGAGITVCERWATSFEAFLEDMGERPPGTSIDRYPDRTGNYEPGNCRWATDLEQQRNRRSTKLHTLHGKTQCQTAWAEEYGIKKNTLSFRLKKGMTLEDALK